MVSLISNLVSQSLGLSQLWVGVIFKACKLVHKLVTCRLTTDLWFWDFTDVTAMGLREAWSGGQVCYICVLCFQMAKLLQVWRPGGQICNLCLLVMNTMVIKLLLYLAAEVRIWLGNVFPSNPYFWGSLSNWANTLPPLKRDISVNLFFHSFSWRKKYTLQH